MQLREGRRGVGKRQARAQRQGLVAQLNRSEGAVQAAQPDDFWRCLKRLVDPKADIGCA
jgi:hypothetical protein